MLACITKKVESRLRCVSAFFELFTSACSTDELGTRSLDNDRRRLLQHGQCLSFYL